MITYKDLKPVRSTRQLPDRQIQSPRFFAISRMRFFYRLPKQLKRY